MLVRITITLFTALLILNCTKNANPSGHGPAERPDQDERRDPVEKPYQDERREHRNHIVFKASQELLRDSSGNQRWKIVKEQEVGLDASSLDSINKLLIEIVETQFGGPFIGYKEYWILPENNLIIGLLDEGFGMSVWNGTCDGEGNFHKDGSIIKFGSPAQAKLFEDLIDPNRSK